MRNSAARMLPVTSRLVQILLNFASDGLDSGYVLCGGSPCAAAAFPGIDDPVGSNEMLFPIGQSVYNALQATVKEDVARPFPAIKHANLQVSYSFSRYVATARDNDFSTAATDFADPNRYIVPTPSIALTRFPSGAIWICRRLPSWSDRSFRQSATVECASACERRSGWDVPEPNWGRHR